MKTPVQHPRHPGEGRGLVCAKGAFFINFARILRMVRTPAFAGVTALFLLFSSPTHAADKVLDIKPLTSPGGIKAWLVEDKTVPVISVSFSFKGGLFLDPEDKPGVGRLVSILLDEGAGDMDSQQFQKQLTDNAISLQFSAGRDHFTGTLKTLRDKKTLAFDLLGTALRTPRFDEDAIVRMKNANTAQIKDNLGNPSWLAARTFNGMFYQGHAYEKPGHGHLKAMDTITRADLVDLVKRQFTRDKLHVAIAGDITHAEAGKMLDTVFSGLPKTSPPADTKDAKIQHQGQTILFPLNTPQTYITAGQRGIDRHDKNWHAAYVMNYILGGGGFNSRLMTEIREKRGLTYGVYSSLVNMDHADALQVSLSTGNDKAKNALDLIKQEWKKMAKSGPTKEEVKNAAAYLTGSLLLQLTSTDAISGAMNSLQRQGFGPDYINKRNDMIRAVTPEAVKNLAAQLLDADALTVVMVGQPENIKPDITLDTPPGMETPTAQ